MSKKRSVVAALIFAASQLVAAHPGHGPEGHGSEVLHPLLGGEHVLLLAVIGLAALLRRHLAGGSDRRDREKRS